MVIPMNPIDSLAALRDIRVPDSPQFWPPAPGWLVVAGLIIAAGVTATVVGVRRWRATRFRREALAYLYMPFARDTRPASRTSRLRWSCPCSFAASPSPATIARESPG